MKKIFISLYLVLLLSLSFAQDNEAADPQPADNGEDESLPIIPDDPPIQIVLYNLPDFLRVSGIAKGDVENEQVKIGLTIETLRQSASESLQQNSDSSSQAINNILLLGLQSSELATSGLSIYPSYTSVYHEKNGTYTQVFEGYRVRNSITVSTKKLDLAGKIIDAAVTSGVNNIDYVTFSPLDSTVSALKEQLLAIATNNASRQANIVLDAVGYEIKSVKTLNIVNNNYSPQPYYAFEAAGKAFDSNSSTQTFEGTSTVSVQVDVAFIIGKKSIASE